MKGILRTLLFAAAWLAPFAQGQTPDDLNEGAKVEWDDTNSIWRFKWWGRQDRTYFIQHSEDLQSWLYLPVIESGNESIREWGFTSNGDRFFLRLRHTDVATSDPWNDDFDGDRVSNGLELNHGADPFKNQDLDNDGLPDDWEIVAFGNLDQGADGDPDADGLTNLQEYLYFSDPMDFGNRAGHPLGDSDGNGLADWWEILYFGALGNDPNQVLANKGGLTLQDAFDNDLDLSESSTVLDEIPDAWKIEHGLDPLDADLANKDPDGDGLTNGDEYDAGSDPMAWDSDGDYIADGSDLYPMVADPSTPGNFRVTVPSWDAQYESPEPDWSVVDYTSIELKWEASSNGASNYKIERREDNDIWHEIATVSRTSHPDTGLVANRHYQYRIWAIKNSGGTEVRSPSATANYQVPLALRMHVKTASVSQWKQGFTEFTSPSTPRKYYLTKTDASSFTRTGSWSDTDSGGSTNESGDYSYSSSYMPSLKKWSYAGSYSPSYDSNSHYGSNNYSSSSSTSSSYNAVEQSRSRTSLSAITQRSSNYSYQSSSSSPSGSSSSSSGNSGSYLYQSTYGPTEGPARWAGPDYDMSLGSIVYSGNSDSSSYSNYSPGSSSSTSGQATANESGQWSGTYTNSSGNTSSISYPPYTSGWSASSWFYDLQSTTQTQRTYSRTSGDYQYQGTQTLSGEFTTEAFVADAISNVADYPQEWTEDYWGWGYYDWGYWGWDYYWGYDGWWYYYGYGYPWYGWWVANRDLSESEEYFGLSKMKYKFEANPSAATTMKWHEVFVPENDPDTPEDESLQIQIVRERTWQLTAQANESPEFEIDPSTEQRGDGYYTIMMQPVHLGVDGIGEAGKDVSGQDSTPGKVVLISDGDADNDAIPDYADGYDFDSQVEDDDSLNGASFAPVYLGVYAADPAQAKIRFTYDASDPTAITRTATNPYQLPASGKLRLWTKDAWGGYDPDTYEQVPRNPDSVKDGGDFIEPGVEYTFEELGIYDYYGWYFSIYAELVKVSGAVADIPLKVEVDPTGDMGFVWSDQVRFTASKIALLSSPVDLSEYSPAAALSPAKLRLYNSIQDASGIAVPVCAIFKVEIQDPRTSIPALTIGREIVTLSHSANGLHQSSPLLPVRLGSALPSSLQHLPRLNIANGNVIISYNAEKPYTSVQFGDLPKEMQQVYSDMQKASKQFHDSGWQPPPDWDGLDTGVYGDAVHQEMSNRYAGKRGRLTDVWLDAEGKVLGFNRGYHWRPGNTTGTTQIDLLIVRGGYRPVEGKPLDRSRLIAPVDFESSGRVKWRYYNEGIATRVRQHTGLELWAPICEHRYNFTLGAMEAGKNLSRATKLLKGVNRALPLAMLLSLPLVADAMDKAMSDAQAFLSDYQNGTDSQTGSQMAMALSVREVLTLTSLHPVQEVGNYYATLALAVLDAAPLFEHDPEYDSAQ